MPFKSFKFYLAIFVIVAITGGFLIINQPQAYKVSAAVIIYTTPIRTLDSRYPTPPDITLNGTLFSEKMNGVTTSFVRPEVASVDITPVGGAYLYVFPGGKGLKNGTSAANAFATIQAAADVSQPGDTIIIAGGTYVERPYISRSGTATQPIKYTHDPNDPTLAVVVIPYGEYGTLETGGTGRPVTGNPVFDIHGAKYVWFNQLVAEGALVRTNCLTGTPARHDWPLDANGNFLDEGYSGASFKISNGAGNGIKILNNIGYWNSHAMVKDMRHPNDDNFTIEANVGFCTGESATRDHGVYLGGINNVVRGNLLFKHMAMGIEGPQMVDSLIENNLLVNNGYAGIMPGLRAKVFHNTSVSNTRAGLTLFRQEASDEIIRNNIFATNTNEDIGFDAYGYDPSNPATVTDPIGNTVDHNLITNKAALDARIAAGFQFGPRTGDIYNTDSQFVDLTNGNYNLKSTSPARGKGSDGSDLGAFPYQVTAPQATIQLTISADKTQAAPGATVTYTISYQNTGSANATNVVISDVIPSSETYVAASASNGGTLTGSTLSWNIGAINAGASGAVNFKVTIN